MCRLAVEVECGLTTERVALNWHAEQRFDKSLEIKEPVLQKIPIGLWRPEVCWGFLSLPGWMFLQDRGRVDNQNVIGYCMRIIWKFKK